MNLAALDPRIPKYRNKGLCLDTNLLLLYLVGELDPRLIARSNRVRKFVVEDFQLVKLLVQFFPKLVTTPGVLTEVSNLAALDHKGDQRTRFFSKFTRQVQFLTEEYIPSKEVSASEPFARLGLTDAALIAACQGKYLTMTTDAALADFMGRNQMDVINFNHIRLLNWN